MKKIELHIIENVVKGEATQEELSAFEKWVALSDDNSELFNRVRDYYNDNGLVEELSSNEIQSSWKRFEKSHNNRFIKKRHKLIKRVTQITAAVAAVVLIGVFVVDQINRDNASAFFEDMVKSEVEFTSKIIYPKENKIDPNKITLTTGKGVICIDSIDKSQLATLPITKMSDKNLSYVTKSEDTVIEFHTLTIPKGKTFSIALSDGTIVHLNANSELIYPSSFAGAKERRVKLSGEGYFEVAHDDQSRFIVETERVDIKVYGTKFNVNTYKKGVIETTLLEGSVSIQDEDSDEIMLKPNQLASCAEGKDIMIKDVDGSNYISWTEGVYNFYDQSLFSIMSSIVAWYGYEVRFSSEKVARMRFICNIPRFDSIDEVMKILSMSKSFTYTIEDNILTITDL